MTEDAREDETAAEIDLAEPELDPERDEADLSDGESDEPVVEPKSARDPLSIALVAGIAALLLICVLLIFVANGHRPAGL